MCHPLDERFAAACQRLIPVLPRLVERPWGGAGLAAYKNFETPHDGARYGEAFEVSAWDADRETAANPSWVQLPGGGTALLTELLDHCGAAILGPHLATTYGARLPLLPKVLCVRELLSVQAHPPQRPEVYIILEAEPGATICLGWRQDVDSGELSAKLEAGRRLQVELLRLVSPRLDEADLGRLVSQRLGSGAQTRELCEGVVTAAGQAASASKIEAAIGGLRELYWEVLERLGEVKVGAGQVIYNAAVGGDSRFPDAEVHALGNPACREILCLEVRLPGTTYRAWDHCRYPLRPVDVGKALSSMPLEGRCPESFIVAPQPVDGYPGVTRSVANGLFIIDHIEVTGAPCTAPGAAELRTLHGVGGDVTVTAQDGTPLGELRRGQCAVVPACLGELVFSGAAAKVVQVTVPGPIN